MTCNTCGEKPKDTAKDFTKAVIEINNPETLVLLRKVVIPASMGAEENVPATIGKYHNVILHYEANKHTYLYSSDGIPTLLETDVPQEVWDSIDELQEEIDEIKNNPDVVDIVDTYADLESYDTSGLSDNDIIRILNDETHDGESSYYRWNTATQTWTFIGATGPYYTKDQTDDLLNEKQDSLTAGDNITIENNVISADDWIITLTSDDYDYPDNNPDGVAVWSLPTGIYRAPNGVNIYNNSATSGSGGNRIFFVNSDLPGSNSIIYYPDANITLSVVNKSTGSLVLNASTLLTSQVVDALTSTATSVPLSANQGRVLKGLIDDAVANIPTVVQTTGTSTTDVMSQNATTSMVYEDPGTRARIRIGSGASAIGSGVAIGINASAQASTNSIAIGPNSATASAAPGSVAIGANALATMRGEFNIGAPYSTNGYNNSTYRLLTGLYDPQNAHDAANKEYVDNIAITYATLNGTAAPTTATVGTYVGQLYLDTTNGALYFLKTIDTTTTPTTYTWEALGGGSSVNVVQTIGASTTDVMSQKAATDTIFADGATAQKIQIGDGAQARGIYANAIGSGAKANSAFALAIGRSSEANERSLSIGISAKANGIYSFAGGVSATASAQGSVAIGAFSAASVPGEINIGSTDTLYGYSSSNYRLLTGLYDPQSDHDAATKGYCDRAIINGGAAAPTTATVGAVGTQYTYVDTSGTPTAHLCVCVAVDTSVTPNTYTWQTLI